MIICFSGTGNTKSAATYLSRLLGDEVVRLAPGLMREPEKVRLTATGGRLIWMFPVHAWGLPMTVKKVISKMRLFSPGDITHHLVCTCGDDIGYADREWRSELALRGWRTASAFSVQMPNIYVPFPGFDVDSPEVAAQKLQKVPERIEAIATAIESGQKVTDVVRGAFPWIKTYVIGRYFRRFMMSTKPFHVTDACMGCGKCARNCPLGCIELVDGKPRWSGKCNMCLRCYHLCPAHAIRYGRHTDGKGQYLHPDFELR